MPASRPDRHRSQGAPGRQPDERPDAQNRQQEPGVDLGQERERPECPRDRHGAEGPRRPNRPLAGQQGKGPEQAQERIECRQMGVGEDAGHRHQCKARRLHPRADPSAGRPRRRDKPTSTANASAGASRPGEDVLSGRVRPLPEHLERFAQLRGDSQQPAAQRRMLGIVAKNAIDDLRVEKLPALLRESSRDRSGRAEHPVVRRSSARAHPA